MEHDSELRKKITEKLAHKATLKQVVIDNTYLVFNELKEVLHELATEIDEELDERIDKRIRIEYRDRGKFEAQVQLADDILLFAMHTDVFQFDRDHAMWKNPYTANKDNAYCGLISIYNFLSDSFKYNRASDEGYLIGRIFVNHDMQYFAEGKRQESHRSNRFGMRRIDRAVILEIVERALDYSLGFDLLVPPFDTGRKVNVEQFNTRNENSKVQTGKRCGFEYRCDDV
jgi:hypothetical protein